MYYRKPTALTVTIPNAGTKSGVIHIRDYVLVGIITPAALTSVTITFEASDTPTGTFVAVFDSDGNQVSLVVAASQAIGLSAAEADALGPWEFVKVVTGAAEAAERTLKLVKK